MRFNLREMTVRRQCTEVEVSLRHSGQLSARIMRHDWVLARDSHVSAIVNAAGRRLQAGYLPETTPHRALASYATSSPAP